MICIAGGRKTTVKLVLDLVSLGMWNPIFCKSSGLIIRLSTSSGRNNRSLCLFTKSEGGWILYWFPALYWKYQHIKSRRVPNNHMKWVWTLFNKSICSSWYGDHMTELYSNTDQISLVEYCQGQGESKYLVDLVMNPMRE